MSLFGRLTFASVRLTDGASPIFQPQSGTILSPEMVDEMIRPEMPTSLPKYYSGLGWAVHFGGDFTDAESPLLRRQPIRTDLSIEAYRNQSEGRGEESYLPEQLSRRQWLLTAVSVLKLILLVVRTC